MKRLKLSHPWHGPYGILDLRRYKHPNVVVKKWFFNQKEPEVQSLSLPVEFY